MGTVFDEVINRKRTNSMKWDELKERYGRDDLLPLWVADMDFRAPQAVIDALSKKVEHGIFGYPTHSRSTDIAIQQWLQKRYDWKVDEDVFLYTSGVVPTINYMIQAFSEEDDEIIIQTPVYYPFYNLVTNNNRTLIRNPLAYDGQRYEIDFDHLREVISEKTKILLLCHPHNPVGRVWKREELEQLAEICKERDLLVISDEIHADLLFKGEKHIPFASLNEDTKARTLTCMAPSKTFNLAGIQSSFAIVENEKMYTKLQTHIANSFAHMSNSFAEIAIESAYTHGEKWLTDVMAYIEENYHFAKQYVEQYMPVLRVMDSEGTYLLWLDCSKLPLTAAERKKWLIDEAKVALNHGGIFGEDGKNFERINLACPRETLLEGLERIRRAYEKNKF